MNHRSFLVDSDIALMRQLISSLPDGPTVVDFEEVIQLTSVRENTRLWFAEDELAAFAYVDDFNNLCFEIKPEYTAPELESQVVAWGVECMRRRNQHSEEPAGLDASCEDINHERVRLLTENGFEPLPERSLHFSRGLQDPIPPYPMPAGYRLRTAVGASEVEALVALHRAAFDSDHMTVEYRLAMMNAPQYAPDMDWLIEALDGSLAAFCIGGLEEDDASQGYLDPIGVHPTHQGKGLGSAIMTAGLIELQKRGVRQVNLGTSSENEAMQALAGKMGFQLISSSRWFTKNVQS